MSRMTSMRDSENSCSMSVDSLRSDAREIVGLLLDLDGRVAVVVTRTGQLSPRMTSMRDSEKSCSMSFDSLRSDAREIVGLLLDLDGRVAVVVTRQAAGETAHAADVDLYRRRRRVAEGDDVARLQ